MKEIQNIIEQVETGKISDNALLLSKSINKEIINIDESLSYKDLAIAVSIILKDSYGKHNFNPFIKELKNHLNIV
tara:strand:- start:452 stop:676 length:225 start_codon:yes stop_codon:yes gene_type:complete